MSDGSVPAHKIGDYIYDVRSPEDQYVVLAIYGDDELIASLPGAEKVNVKINERNAPSRQYVFHICEYRTDGTGSNHLFISYKSMIEKFKRMPGSVAAMSVRETDDGILEFGSLLSGPRSSLPH